MKIACLGNMNNILFQIGRYLLDKKFDVTFFLFDEFDHFLPEADTFEDTSKFKIIRLGWTVDSFSATSKDKIQRLFTDFDVLIGTDLAPAYLFKAGLKLNYFFPHGSDLYELPFFKYKNHPPQLWEIPFNLMCRFQYLGIRNADVIMMDDSEVVYEKPLKKIMGKKFLRIGAPPFLYLEQYDENYSKRSLYFDKFMEIRSKYSLIVFQQISQDWSMRGPFKIDKGNNHLIKGFADLLVRRPDLKDSSVLILMEYGGDVEKSKKLIQELNITEHVIWFRKLQRKDLMVLISIADICIGELGYRTWYSYSSIMEFMAMKKPLMHHRGDEKYSKMGLDLYPMIDVDSSVGVTETLLDLVANRQKYVNLGIEAEKWIRKDNDQRISSFLNSLKGNTFFNRISNYYIKSLGIYLDPRYIYNLMFFSAYRLRNKLS